MEENLFTAQPGFGSPGRINLSRGGGIGFFSFLFSGPEPSSAESNMKSVAVWMCVHTFLLLIGEM